MALKYKDASLKLKIEFIRSILPIFREVEASKVLKNSKLFSIVFCPRNIKILTKIIDVNNQLFNCGRTNRFITLYTFGRTFVHCAVPMLLFLYHG